MTALRGARAAWAARIAWSLLVVLAACGCSGPPGNGRVTVLVSWGGAELASFQNVVNEFQLKTGITVNVEHTRALSEVLGADLLEGDPPDIAALPSVGAIAQYAHHGYLQPLDNVVATTDYGPPWSYLMRPGSGRDVYAVPVKVDVKSLIWYDPAMFRRLGIVAPPTSLTRLAAIDKTIETAGGSPWCLAVASPPTSGWPGADWIADIMLSRYGPTAYQEWVRGELPWTSGVVARSWQAWGQLLGAGNAIYKGAGNALAVNVSDIRPGSGGCYMQHGTLVDENFPKKLAFRADYDFFPFPAPGGSSASGAIQVSGDFIGVFTKNPLANELVTYLTKKATQEAFLNYRVDGQRVDGFSANNQVPPAAYRVDGPAIEQIARLLSQRELCFGAADAMPPGLSTAFYQAILEYLAAPKTLEITILPELQAAANSAALSTTDALSVCGRRISASGRSS